MNRLGTARRRALAIIVAVTVTLISPSPASAGGAHPIRFTHHLLGKAVPDECFAGIGLPYPPGPPCATGQPKVNQAYVWGLTRYRGVLWFGTGANTNCLTSGATLNLLKPSLNDDYVCEYGSSQIAQANPQLPPSVGDQRPPEVFAYGLSRCGITEKTADIRNKSADDAFRLKTTLGLRAAGSFGGVALLAGPSLGRSITMFAFDAESGQYLGSTTMPAYGNIRHFVVADGALYAGVGIGRNGADGGRVLRWTGSKTNPFSFVEVGILPVQSSDLTVHKGRIFTTTWSGSDEEDPNNTAGVWMSPLLSSGEPGLNPADANGWTQVWNTSQYEPDPVIAATYGLGGLASLGDYLYWGTMHVPMKATTVHIGVYPPKDEASARAQVQNTQRAAAIFRGKDFGGPSAEVQLLYGAPQLPAYDPAAAGGAGAWALRPTGYTPLYGPSGFGNKYNNYTWTMTVADGRLFVGMMDWSYLRKDIGASPGPQLTAADPAIEAALNDPANVPDPDPAGYGADLWMFRSTNAPAEAVDTSGVGNYLNYGIRNMVADGSTVYLGMANPMNLRTDPTDAVPEGGWELIRLDQDDD